MKFANWQIDRLRRSLNRYRMGKGRNGQALPWKTVIDNILMSPVTANSYDRHDGDSAFKEEALRRFATGQSTLQADKLEDLRRFFIAEKFLRPEELAEDDDDLPELLAVRDYLANDGEAAMAILAGLARAYRVMRRIDEAEVEIVLHVALDRGGRYVRIEEEFSTCANKGNINRRSTGRHEPTLKTVRKGYGFTSTQLNLLHVFLVGETPENRITYVQIEPFPHAVLHRVDLLRCGDPVKIVRDEQNADAPVQVFNLYKFEGHEFRALEVKVPEDMPHPIAPMVDVGQRLS